MAMENKHVRGLPKKLDFVCERDIEFSGHDHDVNENQDGLEDSRPTFSMIAYTGGAIRVPMWEHPVVIDLDGLDIRSQTRPIRFHHNVFAGVGHSTKIEVVKGQLVAEGIISRATPEAHEVIESARRGFPWQASVGVVPEEVDFVEDKVKLKVNNQSQRGPLYVLRKSYLGEISFVDLGADDRTSVTVQASEQEDEMRDEDKKGNAPDTQVAPKTENAPDPAPAKAPVVTASADDGVKDPTTEPKSPTAPPEDPVVAAAVDTSIADARVAKASEVRRLAAIKMVCDGDDDVFAQAIEGGWSADMAELHILRNRRPVQSVSSTPMDAGDLSKVLECASLVAGRYVDVEKMYDDQTLQASHDRFRIGIGLQELLLEAAHANGYTGRKFDTGREVLEFAFNRNMVQGAFSSVDVSGILSNVANKFLLEGFNSVEGSWRKIASLRSVKDFKQVSSYRLIGTEQYEKIGPGGEIQHGDLDEQKFTNQADTYGLMLAITRTDLINDDLGALTGVPRKLGRGSGLKINDVFWTAFLANSGHFTTGNNNFLDGSSSNLSIDSLTTAEQTFMDQTDTEGKPLGLIPATLLVPTSLSAISASLFSSLEIRDTTSSTKIPVGNPHSGKYSPVISAYLGNSAYTGNSQLAWYLLGNPADMSTIEVAFLNGQESPTIESADANFNVLGIQMRGFHDFGVNLQDPRGGVKTKGEA